MTIMWIKNLIMWVKYLKKWTIFERSILRGLNKKIGIAHFLFLNRKYKNSIYFLTLNIKEKKKKILATIPPPKELHPNPPGYNTLISIDTDQTIKAKNKKIKISKRFPHPFISRKLTSCQKNHNLNLQSSHPSLQPLIL